MQIRAKIVLTNSVNWPWNAYVLRGCDWIKVDGHIKEVDARNALKEEFLLQDHEIVTIKNTLTSRKKNEKLNKTKKRKLSTQNTTKRQDIRSLS